MPQDKKTKTIFLIKPNDPNADDVEVSAGGVILYRIKDGELQLLLMTNRGKLEDLGGTSEKKDKDIFHTVAREVSEESNRLIDKKSILNRIRNSEYILSRTSKYIIFIIKANDDESKLNSEQFGDREIHDDIPRTIDWVPASEFLKSETIKNKLNFRLKNRNVFEYIKKLDPTYKPDQDGSGSKNIVYLF